MAHDGGGGFCSAPHLADEELEAQRAEGLGPGHTSVSGGARTTPPCPTWGTSGAEKGGAGGENGAVGKGIPGHRNGSSKGRVV